MADRETLVLVPGLLCDATVWEDQVSAFEGSYEIVVANTRGCNSIGDMAQRVLDQVDGTFNLAGHSMGARVALEIYNRAPSRVTRIALMDTGVHPRNEGEVAGRMRFVNMAREQGMAPLARAWGDPMVGDVKRGDAAMMQRIYDMVERYSLDDYEGQIQALLDRPDAASVLPSIDCPTLVLVGADDAWSPPVQHEPIVEAVEGAMFVVVEEAGHMAPMEQPAAVTDAMRQWLEVAVA